MGCNGLSQMVSPFLMYLVFAKRVVQNVSVNTGIARLLTVHILKSLCAGSGSDWNLIFPRKKICPNSIK